MNEIEINRLAGAMNQLRPEWPVASLRTFLARHFAERAFRDMVVAAGWICADEKTKTPELLRQVGPWWNVGPASSAQSVPRVGPDVGAERCAYAGHEHEQADRCRLCAAERAAGDVPEPSADAAPAPAAIVEVANRHRVRSAAVGAPLTRSFVQTEELRQPDGFGVATCGRAACGGYYVDDEQGAQAHFAVFGHRPEPTPKENHGEPDA